tara:strand:- start:150 stop:929 length:780 start_codon:yes stop_codon:yes gene_type:complete
MEQSSSFRGHGIQHLIPNDGVGVEVGVYKGHFSEHLLKTWNGILYMVDPWRPLDNYVDESNAKDRYENINETIKNIDGYDDRGRMMRMTSYQASKMFPDNSLDFVYIDANHNYESVKEDLKVWYPKVKKDGYLFGDDYLGFDREWWYKDQNWTDDRAKDKEIKKDGKSLGHFGVNSAVDEFVVDKGIELPLLKSTDEKTAVLNPEGGVTNSKKRNIWWGEWYFKKNEWTETHEDTGFQNDRTGKHLIKIGDKLTGNTWG